jgi:DNA polymerase-3 subunit gamma/tau
MSPIPDQPTAYRVLARTYRPQRLSELIGQEAMVQTLGNAFASGRIAHAFMLSGIRGVGKTTTARIIAAGLNCVGPDGRGGPTPEPCGVCPSCVAVREDRSLDVIEQDAASNTGKGDMIELLEGIAYRPVASRYKVFILDEVHMLSEKAWASLLKTLEEPPPHVKFVLATTELRKVPVTVLSRCQRFALRRVAPELIARHLATVCERERVAAEPDALQVIARVAGGSVRDALSLLDQAIALGEGRVLAPVVREMIGLGDRRRSLALLAAALRGEAGAALDGCAELYALGVDPSSLLQELLALTHRLARQQVDAATGQDPDLDPVTVPLARELSAGTLTRAWQMLLQGLDETNRAPDPMAAVEMVMLRLATAAKLPPPEQLLRLLDGRPSDATGTARVDAEPERSQPVAVAATVASSPDLAAFAELVTMLAERGEKTLAAWLRQAVHLVRIEPGRLEFRAGPGLPSDLPGRLTNALHELTGRRWVVSLASEGGAATLAAQDEAAKIARLAELEHDPVVRGVLDLFPGAKIVDVRRTGTST